MNNDHVMPVAPSRRRRINIETLVISLGLSLGVLLILFGVNSATTGRDALGYPDAIVDVSPAPNDRQVLSQTEINVDLQDGYEASLILDDIAIPTERLDDLGSQVPKPGQQIVLPPTAIYDQGNSRIRFEPTTGAVIESYTVGKHQVEILYWRIEDGRNSARSFTWSFEVL
ncbi:MAG: hypothetical protein WCG40_04385 [Actinomycetes bacterium]